jgi:type II secretion system protein N
MKAQKILKIIAYIGFGLVALLLNFYWTFPEQAVGQRISYEVRRLSQGRIGVTFDNVSLYRLSGVSASGVTVNITGDTTDNKTSFTLEKVKVRLRLLPLLIASLSVDVKLQEKNGTLWARIWRKPKDSFEFSMESEGMDLGKLPLVNRPAGVPLQGKLNGTAEAYWDSQDARKSTGKGALVFKGMGIGPASIQGFTLPSVSLGQIDFGFNIDAGRMKITNFKQTGGQVLAQISANATLRPPIATSPLNACLQFKGDEKFLTANPNIKAALQLAEVQLQKDPNGFLNVPLVGTLGQPHLRNGLCQIER